MFTPPEITLSLWRSITGIPGSIQLMMNIMSPFGILFIRRFIIWFPVCCLASRFIMQTHVVFDCSRQSVDEEELEFDDSSEQSEELESPMFTNTNTPRNGGSMDAQPQMPDPPSQSPLDPPNRIPSGPGPPDSWVDVSVPLMPPDDPGAGRRDP